MICPYTAGRVKGKGRSGKPALPPAGNSVRRWAEMAHPFWKKAASGGEIRREIAIIELMAGAGPRISEVSN